MSPEIKNHLRQSAEILLVKCIYIQSVPIYYNINIIYTLYITYMYNVLSMYVREAFNKTSACYMLLSLILVTNSSLWFHKNANR